MINSENSPRPPENFCIGSDLQNPNTFLQEGKGLQKYDGIPVNVLSLSEPNTKMSYIHIPLVIQGHLTPI